MNIRQVIIVFSHMIKSVAHMKGSVESKFDQGDKVT